MSIPPPADPPGLYCDAPKALYAWSCTLERTRDGESGWWQLVHQARCHDRLVEFAAAHHVDRVYLYVGAVEWDWAGAFSAGTLPYADDVAVLTARLRSAGIEPWALWYLNDDPDDLGHAERVVDVVSAVDAFSRAHPDGAFAGLPGDQEPNDPAANPAYLAMTEAGRDAAVAVGLGFGAAHKPAWILGADPLSAEILARSTAGTLMDYTDDPALAADRGDRFLAGADAVGVTGELALETGTTDPTPGVSFATLVATDPEGFFAMVGDLHAGWSAHPGYDGIAIHDFAQYFAGLNGGVGPYDFDGVVPVICPPATTGTTGTDGTTVPTGSTGTTVATGTTGGTTGADPSDVETSGPTADGCGCGSRSGSAIGAASPRASSAWSSS
ncbi:MAG: hypothetical protein ABMB14_27080 [Myxococcota bacterium]